MFQDFGKRLFVEAEFLDAVAADFPALVFDESFSFIAEYAGRSILSQYNAAVFKKDLYADAGADLKPVSHLDRKYYSSELVDFSYDS